MVAKVRHVAPLRHRLSGVFPMDRPLPAPARAGADHAVEEVTLLLRRLQRNETLVGCKEDRIIGSDYGAGELAPEGCLI